MSLSKTPSTPLSPEERQVLGELLRRVNIEDSLKCGNSVVSWDSDWAVPNGLSMTDASKRRCSESPQRERRYHGCVPETQIGVPMPSLVQQSFGRTKSGTEIVMPEGLDSLAMWGRSVIEFGKFAPKGVT